MGFLEDSIAYTPVVVNKKLDPRTLFLVNMELCIAMFLVAANEMLYASLIMAIVLMLYYGMYKTVSKFVAFMGAWYALVFFQKLDWLKLYMVMAMLLHTISKFIPVLMISTIIVTKVQTGELIMALQKLKLPKGMVLAVTVGIRFIPTIKQEATYIQESMILRGLGISFRNLIKSPVRLVEYTLIPLLFRSLKIAEELIMTALTRGIECDQKRTSYYETKMKALDFL